MKILLTLLSVSMLSILAACAGGTAEGDTAVSAAEVGDALDAHAADLALLRARFEADPAATTLASDAAQAAARDLAPALGAAEPSGTTPVGDPRPAPQQAADALPTGEFLYDPDVDAFVDTHTIHDDLVYRWSTEREGESVLRLDWDALGETVEIDGHEAFTGLTATLAIGDATAAEVDVTVDRDDDCSVPSRVTVDGVVGIDATLTAREATVGRDASGVDTSGSLLLEADGDSAEVRWAADLDGAFFDAGCEPLDRPVLDSGTIAFGTSSTVNGDTTGFDVDLAFADVVTDATGVRSASVDGSLHLNGTRALTFAGTLNDADADGTPGDDLTLTFADGASSTLEAFLENETTLTVFDGVARWLR